MAQMKDPRMSHVNLMVDTVIANLPEEGLRSVMRSMLSTDPSITSTFEARTRNYLLKSIRASTTRLLVSTDGETATPTHEFHTAQQRLRSMLGCGLCYEIAPLLTAIIKDVTKASGKPQSPSLMKALSALDGDIVQMVTAVQKTLFIQSGTRPLAADDRAELVELFQSLQTLQAKSSKGFVLGRGLSALVDLLQVNAAPNTFKPVQPPSFSVPPLPSTVETFKLKNHALPRLFSGLWQLSSPSWGSASTAQIQAHFQSQSSQGFTAYDMADHYGDAELIFGDFRTSCSNPEQIFGATKYCVFAPVDITQEVVAANVTERCERMKGGHLDLLQFHWQVYKDKQYLQALRYLQDDSRVDNLGLCNFDTQHMEEAIEAGISIATNQVQLSLIDSRPVFKMGAVCEKYDVKLLTYGTLCGGFIAEKWLGQPEPELFHSDITPSLRKYYEMILNWGGWELFQELLSVLKDIAEKHNVAISNVATRWVLDFNYVGAVIIGNRMGVSEHAKENLATYGWRLDGADLEKIESILKRSKKSQLIELLGDCGGEYR